MSGTAGRRALGCVPITILEASWQFIHHTQFTGG